MRIITAALLSAVLAAAVAVPAFAAPRPIRCSGAVGIIRPECPRTIPIPTLPPPAAI